MIFREWKSVFLCTFVLIVLWLFIKTFFKNVESFEQLNDESSSDTEDQLEEDQLEEDQLEEDSSSDTEDKNIIEDEEEEEEESDDTEENEETEETEEDDGEISSCELSSRIYLSKENVKSIEEDFERYEELLPIIDMFKNENLIVENIDSSIEYRDGYIDDLYFDGMNKLSCKQLRNYFNKKTSNEYLSPLIKKSSLENIKKTLVKAARTK